MFCADRFKQNVVSSISTSDRSAKTVPAEDPVMPTRRNLTCMSFLSSVALKKACMPMRKRHITTVFVRNFIVND